MRFWSPGFAENELASLTFDDINWEARELTVRKGIAEPPGPEHPHRRRLV